MVRATIDGVTAGADVVRIGRIQGGGALVGVRDIAATSTTVTGVYRVTPTGEVSRIAYWENYPFFYVGFARMFSDGSICGYSAGFGCLTVDGVWRPVVNGDELPPTTQWGREPPDVLPLSDTHLLYSGAAGTWAIDIQTMVAVHIDERTIIRPQVAIDGSVWGVAISVDPAAPIEYLQDVGGEAVRVTLEGLVPLALPDIGAVIANWDGTVRRIVPGENVFLVMVQGAGRDDRWRIIRLPAP